MLEKCTPGPTTHQWVLTNDMSSRIKIATSKRGWYFDEWDKALRARGLVKQQRELYRQRSDYKESLGAFEWLLDEDMHPDVFVGDLATWWLNNYPVTQPLFLEIGFPGPHPPYDPIPRYTERYLAQKKPQYFASHAARTRLTTTAVQRNASS